MMQHESPLYNKRLMSSPALVSIKSDNREYLLDSINSSEEVTNFLNNKDISTADFELLHYSDSISDREAFALRQRNREPPTDPSRSNFFTNYWLYLYEAIPYAKLLTKIGLDIRVFNFDRPPNSISIRAKKPNMLMALASLLMSLLVMLILMTSGILKKLHGDLAK